MREHLVRQESYSFMVEMCEKHEAVRLRSIRCFISARTSGAYAWYVRM